MKEELDVLSFRRQNKLKTQMTEDEKQQFIQRHMNDHKKRQVRQRSNEVEKERRLQKQLQTFFKPNINNNSRKSLNASKISRAG